MIRKQHVHSAFTLIEVLMSTMLIGVVMVAALNSLGAATSASLENSNHARAVLLAEDLMAEILNQAYRDPNDTVVFGVESGETDTNRADFDDVDDYDDWNSSPPIDKAGNALAAGSTWRRKVEVLHVDPNAPTDVSGDADDQGAKRIRITVKHNGTTVFKLRGIATPAWPIEGK